MAEEARYLTLVNATGAITRRHWQGREHVVVPVVALVEGVIHAVNAPTPELVRAAEFSASLSQWDGKPVFAGHPTRNGVPVSGCLPEVLPSSMGVIRYPTTDGQRLLMEAWLDPTKCIEGDAKRILDAVTAMPPQMVEVSVGAFVNAQASSGIWKNKKAYKAEWKGTRADHLAMLISKPGACSIEMGCGAPRMAMRVAESEELEVIEQEEPSVTLITRVAEFLKEQLEILGGAGSGHFGHGGRPGEQGGASEEGKSHHVGVTSKTFKNKDGEDVKTFSGKAGTYQVHQPTGSDMHHVSEHVDGKPQHVEEHSSHDGAVSAATAYAANGHTRHAEAEIVVPEPELKAACACGGKHDNATRADKGVRDMNREARIAALASNPHSAVKSLKMLEAATDEELTAIEVQAGEIKAAADKQAVIEKENADLKAAAATTAERITALEASTSAMEPIVSAHKAAEAAEKVVLVGKLKVAQEAFSEEELGAKELPELRKLATALKVNEEPKRDFSLANPRAAESGENPYAPPDPYKTRQKATIN